MKHHFKRNGVGGKWLALALLTNLAIAECCLAAVEDRINEAVPLPKSLQYAKDQLLRMATDSGDRAPVDVQINAKLRVRALDCAQGYAPGPFTSKEEIAAHFGVSDCFERKDDELATWIGWRRVGILVRMQAIRPIPKSTPAFVIGSDYIQQVKIAANAGVMLLWTNRSLELLDLNNGRRVSRLEGLGGDAFGELSPNGRVLPTSVPGGTSLIDVESGESLARVQSIFPRDFTWLDRDRALIHRGASMNSFTVDFDSGDEHLIRFPKEAIDQAISLSPQNAFFALTESSALRFHSGDGRSEEPLTLLDQKPFKIQNWQRNQGEMTADDRFYVIAAQDLNFISTGTLLTTTIAVAPFEIRTLVPQPNPDLMLLIGDNPGIDRNMGMRYYIYSISRQTFSQPDETYRNHGRIVYLANIHKLGFVSQNRVALLDSLPVEEAMSREDFVGLMTREQEQHRAAMAQESRGPHIAGSGPVRVETLPGARVTMVTSGNNWTVSLAPGSSAALDGGSVEGIGIEQTSNHVMRPDGTKQGVAVVHVKRGNGAPISLVLSSHESVRWVITVERGAVIKSIMTAGPNPAVVIGAGAAPVTHLTDVEASQTNTADYERLQAQVLHATGARIHRFQGAFVGSEFTVDGH